MALQRRMRIVKAGIDNGQKKALTNIYIRVAFATSDMKHVNQHFGSAKSLVVYDVNPDETQIVEVAEFDYINHDENESKLVEKLEILKGCVAIYSQAVGSSAAQKLLAVGIQPVKVHDGAEISVLLEYLQEEMMQGPSTWLAKAITRQKNPYFNRFDETNAESWDE